MRPNSASGRRGTQCSPPYSDRPAVCGHGGTVQSVEKWPQPDASQGHQPCLENHDPLYYHRPGAESRTQCGKYHSPPVCTVKVQSPAGYRDRGKGQPIRKPSTLFGISSCAMSPKDSGHIAGHEYIISPSKDISSHMHFVQDRRTKHCHGDCSTPRNVNNDVEQHNLCTALAQTPVSPKSPAGCPDYDGGLADGDLHTILSPMSASFYQATGCLRDEWSPQTPVDPWPSSNGHTGISDDSQSLPQTPLSPLSASFYEATGCLPNEMLQSPSMYEHNFVNSPLQRVSMIMSPNGKTQHAKDYQKASTEIKRHDYIECNSNNHDTGPFSKKILGYLKNTSATHGRSEQSSARAHHDPELQSPLDTQSCRFNPKHPLHIGQCPCHISQTLCHPTTPLFPPEPYAGPPAEISVRDDPNTPWVTTPLSQDFVGLLENHLEVCVTRQEIRDHNQRLGWQQWFAFKGNVYTTVGFRDHFLAFNEMKAGQDTDQPRTNNDSTSSGVSSEAGTTKRVLRDNQSQTQELSPSRGGSNHAGSLWEQREHLAGEVTVPTAAIINDGGLANFNAGCDSDDDNNSENDSRGSDGDNDGNDEDDESAEEREYRYMWRYDVLAALRKTGLSTVEIESEIGVFRIGSLKDPTEPKWRFWDSVRADVVRVCDDLMSRGVDVSEYQREYLTLLQRWLWRYGEVDPETGSRLLHTGVDGNERAFLLPSRQDPRGLRPWMADLPAMDTSLPLSGYGWPTLDYPLLPPLGDTHSLFVASLRQHPSSPGASSPPAFRHDIDGVVAWAELASDVIRDDVMTPNQVEVLRERAARGSRTAAGDPTRMARRREALGRYFARSHRVGEDVIHRYLAWADIMARGWCQFQALCQQHK